MKQHFLFLACILMAGPAYAVSDEECHAMHDKIQAALDHQITCNVDRDCAWIPTTSCPWSLGGGSLVKASDAKQTQELVKKYESCNTKLDFQDEYRECMKNIVADDDMRDPAKMRPYCRNQICAAQ